MLISIIARRLDLLTEDEAILAADYIAEDIKSCEELSIFFVTLKRKEFSQAKSLQYYPTILIIDEVKGFHIFKKIFLFSFFFSSY